MKARSDLLEMAIRIKNNCDGLKTLIGSDRLSKMVESATNLLASARSDSESKLQCAIRLCKELRSQGIGSHAEEIVLIGVALNEF